MVALDSSSTRPSHLILRMRGFGQGSSKIARGLFVSAARVIENSTASSFASEVPLSPLYSVRGSISLHGRIHRKIQGKILGFRPDSTDCASSEASRIGFGLEVKS
jgi:hypothetical protein